MKDKYYITTTLPYVNGEPHIGFAAEIVRADIVARFKKAQGQEVFFNTGTDEHGQKIYQKAIEEGETPQEYVDACAKKFEELKSVLNLSTDSFLRTTSESHVKAAQEFWNRCNKNGDIYKKLYAVKYCVGCELEKTDSELEDGRCPIHPNKDIELIEEENYFFRFSKYQSALLELYEKNPDFVLPETRLHEIKSFVSQGLTDFSISRLKSKMPWGVPVPNDDSQVMYVWFDALVSYISAIGFPSDMEMFNKWWPVTQVAGKDNLRQQSAMWQAMLLSSGILLSKQIIIFGFIVSDGQKMSKSLGNVISPEEIVRDYGTDALRYYIARELHPFEDSDMTMEKFKMAYNANLANGLGNLVSRVMKMASDNVDKPDSLKECDFPAEYTNYLEKFEINKASDFIWAKIAEMDGFIQREKPFVVVKSDSERGKEMIKKMVGELSFIAFLLTPILPETAEKIKNLIKENKVPNESLFPRRD